jgi:restriction endonuclease S subunit
MTAAPLNSLCQVKHGGTPSKAVPAYWQGSIPWVSPKDMKTSVLLDATDHITEEAVADSTTSLVPEGAILVVARSGILAHTLPVAQAGKPVAFNQDIKALLPDCTKVDPAYLYWFVRSCENVVLSLGVKRGATVHSLQSGFLENLAVPLPSREEQRRIVDLLSRAEGIVRLRREAQAKAQAITPALLLDMFGDPATNPKRWDAARLGDVAADVRNGFNPAKDDFGSGTSFITVADLYSGLRINTSRAQRIDAPDDVVAKYRLRRGDLCFVRSSVKRAGVGMVSVFDEDTEAVFGGFVIRVRLSEVLDPLVACAMFQTVSIRKLVVDSAGTGTITNINQPALLSLPVVLPPPTLQQEFVEHLLALDSIHKQQATALSKAERTFQSLLVRAFSGNLTANPTSEEIAA